MKSLEAHLDDGEPLALPLEAAHLLDAMRDLVRTRGSVIGARGEALPLPVSHSEIMAWAALNEPLSPWEVRAIRAMDDVILRHHDARRQGVVDPARRASARKIDRILGRFG